MDKPSLKVVVGASSQSLQLGDFSKENNTLYNQPQPDQSSGAPSHPPQRVPNFITTTSRILLLAKPVSSDQEIDGPADCQRSDLWTIQNAWTPGPGLRSQWIFAPFLLEENPFFSYLQTIVSKRPCSPVGLSYR